MHPGGKYSIHLQSTGTRRPRHRARIGMDRCIRPCRYWRKFVKELIREPNADTFGAGTVAVQVGKELWVGSFRGALHKKSWAVIDRPYSLGCATVGALYERPRCIFCAKPFRGDRIARFPVAR